MTDGPNVVSCPATSMTALQSQSWVLHSEFVSVQVVHAEIKLDKSECSNLKGFQKILLVCSGIYIPSA